jgi:hypothetical protein
MMIRRRVLALERRLVAEIERELARLTPEEQAEVIARVDAEWAHRSTKARRRLRS